jgi:hypothetical protein
MEAAADDPRRMKDAVQLMGPESQAVLQRRAERASTMMGRRFLPHEVLAEGKLGLKFRPKRYTTDADGHTLRVIGADTGDTAEIHCVDESGHFRIEPELPAETTPILRAR